jgi:hypothetical protein
VDNQNHKIKFQKFSDFGFCVLDFPTTCPMTLFASNDLTINELWMVWIEQVETWWYKQK